MSEQRPNILFFFSDQQRADTCGCYGQELPVTPNLDAMAAEGVCFEGAFSCQPVCGPARACLQTGKWATETGAFRNGIALRPDERTIAHYFSDAGYEVGYIGKWHLASTQDLPDRPDQDYRTEPVPLELRGGWKDYWLASDVLEFTSHGYDGHMFDADMKKVEFQGYRADCQTDFALDYLRTRTGEKPWFLFLSYIEPHHQNDRKHCEGPEGSKQRFQDFKAPGDLEGTKGNWREEYPDYLGCCSALDTGLGRLRAELEKLGLAENTLIIYAADHGSHFRTRNGEYKRSCHDGSLRIPLVACGPEFRGGRRVENLVSLLDLPATFMAAGGMQVPDHFGGRALQSLSAGSATDWPDEVFAQISESQVGRCIRTSKWKYSVRAPESIFDCRKPGWECPDSILYFEEFLYDLEADPYERDNLVRDPELVAVRAELASRLKRRMIEAGETEPEIRSAAHLLSATGLV
jgi:arylsulfatase A-like enzyme